ncbi:MAG: polyamine aminopropyltransferase [Oscillospiraceae bacterium]|nr:polyamine aminopropyltransferase [Oscillospiraceae bacterium]
MELWYSEKHTKNVKFSLKIHKHLYSGKSDFQRIDVFESAEFGKILTLDGYLMFTEKDEFIYHEMITHVPMAVHPDAKTVLIIGAGDGGVLRMLVQYPGVERIDISEIDAQVVNICREYFPEMTRGFDDKRVNVYYQDGLKFIRKYENEYDIIIVDSTDPFGPGEVLFTKEFYGNCFKALKDDGIIVTQHESPFYKNDAVAMQRAHKRIIEFFDINYVYQAHIPTYPSGHWLFGFSSKKYHPIRDINQTAWETLNLKTKYYNTTLHKGAFCLPTYVKELLENAE